MVFASAGRVASRQHRGRVFVYTYEMSWASRRRTFVVGGVLAILIGVIAVVLVATLYDVPSCTDSTRNQGEDGIDCGGPWAHPCPAAGGAPSVPFLRPP